MSELEIFDEDPRASLDDVRNACWGREVRDGP